MKKITQLLTRTNKEITQARAERITNSVETSFQKHVLDLQGDIDTLEDRRERMLDMSASNNTTTRNAIDDLEADGFVSEIIEIDTKIELKRRHLKIARDAKSELLGNVKDSE